jgi:transglutaminase-like putative cysteine protease
MVSHPRELAMRSRFILVIGWFTGLWAVSAIGADAVQPKSRSFLFTYRATVTGLEPGKKVRVWLPVPPSNEQQTVRIEARDLPAREQIGKEATYGNEILYFEAAPRPDGTLPLSLTYRVTRKEVKGEVRPADEDMNLLKRLLAPDLLVPVDGKPLELVKGRTVPMDQVAAARLFYDLVNAHMKYSKQGSGWGRGDAVWACDSKYGNCSDFHSLFISLARAHRIPARFEIGFPLPAARGAGEIGGYHCWAWCKPAGRGWLAVDISEANKDPRMTEYYFGNLTEDRVTFSTGRDLTLTPSQDGPPVNFLIYPYVEVEGKPVPSERVQKQFSFKDVP